MLDWSRLLNEGKRKEKHSGEAENAGTAAGRVVAERDYDRILFANPTRRLADKTQVFPLDPNDSVRTRLTHSMEVSNLCRSIGMKLVHEHRAQVFGDSVKAICIERAVPAMLAAIGLAHDLGNPPFGHQGEEAVRWWFSNRARLGHSLHSDFRGFDGNPQTLRLLTRLQILDDDFGLNLSYGTLAALIKYPQCSAPAQTGAMGPPKFGVFQSERPVAEDIWQETGLAEGVRHPLTYVMEACDDIAYCVLDAEDTVKKGYASFYDLMDFLEHEGKGDETIDTVLRYSRGKNHQFRQQELTSSELNEISMQLFRVQAIFQLVQAATVAFVESIDRIMAGEGTCDLELLKVSKASLLCKSLKKFDKRYGFNHQAVYRLELCGHNAIVQVMDMLWEAIREPGSPFGRYACTQISENYKRARGRSQGMGVGQALGEDYLDCQLLADSVAGMTDGYLMTTLRNLQELHR